MYSRAADTRSEDRPAGQAPRHMGSPAARMSGKRSQRRVLRSRLPGEEKALGTEPAEPLYGPLLDRLAIRPSDSAENNQSWFVTTDRYKYAGYHAEPMMRPRVPVMSQKSWQGPSMEDPKIFGDAATHRAVE